MQCNYFCPAVSHVTVARSQWGSSWRRNTEICEALPDCCCLPLAVLSATVRFTSTVAVTVASRTHVLHIHDRLLYSRTSKEKKSITAECFLLHYDQTHHTLLVLKSCLNSSHARERKRRSNWIAKTGWYNSKKDIRCAAAK